MIGALHCWTGIFIIINLIELCFCNKDSWKQTLNKFSQEPLQWQHRIFEYNSQIYPKHMPFLPQRSNMLVKFKSHLYKDPDGPEWSPYIGDVIPPVKIKDTEPEITYMVPLDHIKDGLMTLVVLDLDVPEKDDPDWDGAYVLWLKINMIKKPPNLKKEGEKDEEVIASYTPPAPPPGTGLHRILIAQLKQKHIINLDMEPHFNKTYRFYNRGNFYLDKFMLLYNMTGIDSAFFFYSEYDPYVDFTFSEAYAQSCRMLCN